jgi:hypothetical protein
MGVWMGDSNWKRPGNQKKTWCHMCYITGEAREQKASKGDKGIERNGVLKKI